LRDRWKSLEATTALLFAVVRFVLNCLFDATLPMLEGRYFTVPAALYGAPLIEVDDPDRIP